uniref:Uncharacterized protein n=1 Tax=Gopherus evgoodei TaxID=1825980 RepID=A0A8C4Y9E7_9SAUR
MNTDINKTVAASRVETSDCFPLNESVCRLRDCHLTDVCCGDLSSFLSTSQTLSELNLKHNKLEDSGVQLLCEGLKHPRLQKLIIGLLSMPVTQELASFFSHCYGSQEVIKSSPLHRGRTNLSSCKLSFAFPEDLSPKTLFTNKSLEKLDLSANTLGELGLQHLCEGLKHPHCNLQTLLLWQCSLTAACCGDLAAALSTNQCVTELELSGNELGDSGIKVLCEGLKHPRCKLQKLM